VNCDTINKKGDFSMRNIRKILWGVILLAVGVIIVLNTLGVTHIDVWFPGWWTLFIIIPCLVGLFTERDKTGNAVGLGIGVLLLLSQLDIIDSSLVWKLILPIVIIVAALKMIFSGIRKKNSDGEGVIISVDAPEGTAIFGSKDMNFDGQVFDGAELNAIFGGVECDLRGAVITKDCRIKANAIFGGVDIHVPRGVNVKVSSTNIFGGTDDESVKDADASVTLYIDAVSIFGGVDIN
jgi:predicted membrane protein